MLPAQRKPRFERRCEAAERVMHRRHLDRFRTGPDHDQDSRDEVVIRRRPGLTMRPPLRPTLTNGKPWRSDEFGVRLEGAVRPVRFDAVVDDKPAAGDDEGPDRLEHLPRGKVEIHVQQHRADRTRDVGPAHLRAVARDDAVVRIAQALEAMFEHAAVQVGIVRDFRSRLAPLAGLMRDALRSEAVEGVHEEQVARVAGRHEMFEDEHGAVTAADADLHDGPAAPSRRIDEPHHRGQHPGIHPVGIRRQHHVP